MKLPFDELHKAFESRVRLGIMAALAVNDALDFTALREYLNVTDGNLATHIKKLENEDFIGIKKSFIDNKPNTSYYLTATGKKAFDDYLSLIEEIIKAKKES